MKPNILDPKFKYVPAAATDVAKTFERVRREMREAEKKKAVQRANVRDLSGVFGVKR